MIYHNAMKIKNRYKINGETDYEYLILVLHKMGCNVSSYSAGKFTLPALGLKSEIKKASSITVTDESGNITVYYNEKLSQQKIRFALAHEIGHIVMGHIDKKGNKNQEVDADKFAEYLLFYKTPLKAIDTTLIIIGAILILLIVLLVTAISLSAIGGAYDTASENSSMPAVSNSVAAGEENQNSDIIVIKPPTVPNSSAASSDTSADETDNKSVICYYSKYGSVYHLYRDCHYIINSKRIYTDTVENCKHSKLCSACERRQNSNN